jgi:hypothetical protein
MKDAQQEIKSTVTVNTSDIAAKAHEDKEQGKELEKISRKKGGEYITFEGRNKVLFSSTTCPLFWNYCIIMF